MSLFNWFKRRSPQDSIEQAMLELAPKIFPGGHPEILEAGKNISALLGGKLSPQESSRIYSSAKYLMYTSKDHSQEKITRYIQSRGNGHIAMHQADQIYRFLMGDGAVAVHESKKNEQDDLIFIDADITNRTYQLRNHARTVMIEASVFTYLVIIAKQAGWSGCESMFSPDGNALKTLTGKYIVDDHDAVSLATTLQIELKKKGVVSRSEEMHFILDIISFFAEGAFEIHA